MFSLKSYIKSLLKQNTGNIHELDSTLFDKFYAENSEFIDAKILEIWEQKPLLSKLIFRKLPKIN